jgi:hypothetical protein
VHGESSDTVSPKTDPDILSLNCEPASTTPDGSPVAQMCSSEAGSTTTTIATGNSDWTEAGTGTGIEVNSEDDDEDLTKDNEGSCSSKT